MENQLEHPFVTKQFVTFNIAKQLKELGFDEQCLGFYPNTEKEIIQIPMEGRTVLNHLQTAAPLWQQAIDWLRLKHAVVAYTESLNLISFKPKVYYLGDEWEGSLDVFEYAREVSVLKALELITKKLQS